mmetsp:Transcript_26794/g.72276  ORF Transcript_26794/g.72276 Transcript_26794/m.72276 type:complete len:161 (+) Transcript_26794:186-668(+)
MPLTTIASVGFFNLWVTNDAPGVNWQIPAWVIGGICAGSLAACSCCSGCGVVGPCCQPKRAAPPKKALPLVIIAEVLSTVGAVLHIAGAVINLSVGLERDYETSPFALNQAEYRAQLAWMALLGFGIGIYFLLVAVGAEIIRRRVTRAQADADGSSAAGV